MGIPHRPTGSSCLTQPSATERPRGPSVRLACLRHAASVRPEPGSNSPLNSAYRFCSPPAPPEPPPGLPEGPSYHSSLGNVPLAARCPEIASRSGTHLLSIAVSAVCVKRNCTLTMSSSPRPAGTSINQYRQADRITRIHPGAGHGASDGRSKSTRSRTLPAVPPGLRGCPISEWSHQLMRGRPAYCCYSLVLLLLPSGHRYNASELSTAPRTPERPLRSG